MARFALALLLLTLAGPSMAEEEPKASAPLPPPLPAAEPDTAAQAPRSAVDPRQQPALGEHGVSRSPGGKAARHLRDRSGRLASRRGKHPAIASSAQRRHDQAPLEPMQGRLSPPPDQHPAARLESAAIPLAPPRGALPYYPEYPPVPPTGSYAPRYPYLPPAPEPFRRGF